MWHSSRLLRYGFLFGLGIVSISCTQQSSNVDVVNPILSEKNISHLIPIRVRDRGSWAKDINQIMDTLVIEKNKKNVCSIIAVVDQESNFVADPKVPNLGKTAVKEVSSRLEEKFTDKLGDHLGKPIADYFLNVLKTQPSVKNSYLNQMKMVKTEKELDILYRQIFDYMAQHYHVRAITGAAKLIGQDIGERMNPITTLGSMQVLIQYAQEHQRNNVNIYALRDDLYSQYGGLYYGIHRLMLYRTNYKKRIYRFADYNSGMYSSRNAAFQRGLSQLTQIKLALDGDLLRYDKHENVQSTRSQSELALNQLFTDQGVTISAKQVRNDLKKEKQFDFENTQTYLEVKRLYQRQFSKQLSYAVMPEVVIAGPKLSRDYNTNWYASQVNSRYEACMYKAGVRH